MKRLIVGAVLMALAGGASATEWEINSDKDIATERAENNAPVIMIVAKSIQGIMGPSLAIKINGACKAVSLKKGESRPYGYMTTNSVTATKMWVSCISGDSVLIDAEDVQAKRYLYEEILSNKVLAIRLPKASEDIIFTNKNGRDAMMQVLGTEHPDFQ